MCYGSRCPHEVTSGENIGQCRASYSTECPMEMFLCAQCNARIEEDESIATNGYCYACVPEEC